MSVEFAQWREPALLFFVLAHLDLGRDAANIYDPKLPARDWAEPLRAAYQRATNRLTVHGFALHHPHELSSTVGRLSGEAQGTDSDRSMWRALEHALDAERTSFEPHFAPERPEILEPLDALRTALWERIGTPPPLTIVDCPALRHAGRAVATESGRRVAVSLAESPEHLLCQVLHEEVHAVTDPAVVAQWTPGETPRDTAVGSAGFARHQELELAAVEVGDALIRTRAPEWNDAYREWRTRMGA